MKIFVGTSGWLDKDWNGKFYPELKQWADFIKSKNYLKKFYIYFNNDFYGYAIENAKTLRNYLES